ncbi:MAG: hypothetical protein IT379_00555 [Deltaproteobacteria bacterium]|nr:hypothetical protein [Deltaproteobacteria bacterium]
MGTTCIRIACITALSCASALLVGCAPSEGGRDDTLTSSAPDAGTWSPDDRAMRAPERVASPDAAPAEPPAPEDAEAPPPSEETPPDPPSEETPPPSEETPPDPPSEETPPPSEEAPPWEEPGPGDPRYSADNHPSEDPPPPPPETSVAHCGNRIVEESLGETCEEHSECDADRICRGCRCELPFCGDGVVSAGEECDGVSWEPCRTCSSDCRLVPTGGRGCS